MLEKRHDYSKPFLGAISFNISNFEEELIPAPQHFEEGVTLTVEQLVEIDLGTANQNRPTFIGSGLFELEKINLIELLKGYVDCFAWSYVRCQA